MAEIVIRNLRKEFGAFTAVKGSSFTIKDGEFFMLLGPSGCGKTTTLRMIAGFVDPTGGTIFAFTLPVELHHRADPGKQRPARASGFLVIGFFGGRRGHCRCGWFGRCRCRLGRGGLQHRHLTGQRYAAERIVETAARRRW